MKIKFIFLFFFLFLKFNSFSQLTYIQNDTINSFSFSYAFPTPENVKSIIFETTHELSRFIKTDIKIRILIKWQEMGANVEASCSSNEFVRSESFKNAPYKNILYPISLAEKLSGQEINKTSDPDLVLLINSKMNWYLKSDGKTDSSTVDLYTVLLHEICHGIGFQSNYTTKDNLGLYNGIGLPFLFDKYIYKNKDLVIDSNIFKNKSKALYDALVSDSLFFLGTFEKICNTKIQAKLYSPHTFDFGSSISHLDDNTYPKGSINSLMNHGKSHGESIHNLGPITKGILADIGWTDFLISVNQIKDNENLHYQPEILVYIDTIFNPSTAQLHYSYDDFSNEVIVPLTKTDTLQYFKAIIPDPNFLFERNIGYYITCKDKSGNNTAGIPLNYPYNYYKCKIGKDTIKPIIEFSPFSELIDTIQTLSVSAKITDNIGVDSVWIEYLINSKDLSKSKKVRLQKSGNDFYSGSIILKGLITTNTIFYYKIYAVDNSIKKNVSSTVGDGFNGFYESTISKPRVANYSLDDNFEDSTVSKDKFTLNGFFIQKPNGFTSFGLHTKHPYPTAFYSGKTIDLTATTKNPIIIRTNEAYLDFDEIVLVEPSENGTSFGDYAFWDYCIVEGSKDKINWYAFEQKGYKTELFSDWLSTYNSKPFSDNSGRISSKAVADESLYHHHQINLLGNKYLRKGDNVYIRFRLFSDAFVNGWGWAIDNVKIQTTPVLSSNKSTSDTILVYPTCTSNNTITIKSTSQSQLKIKKVEMIAILGNSYKCSVNYINDTEYSVETPKESGVYFINIILEDYSVYTKKIIVLPTSME